MLVSVQDACTLQDNALDIRVADQIEQLDKLIRLEGRGKAFFAKTHITHGMRTLLSEGLARLAGRTNQAAFHLKQAMGGGKTHLFDILGGLPDTIEDEWIEDVARLEEMMDRYIHLRTAARNAFELRYEASIAPDAHRWDLCARVLSRQDIVAKMSEPW